MLLFSKRSSRWSAAKTEGRCYVARCLLPGAHTSLPRFALPVRVRESSWRYQLRRYAAYNQENGLTRASTTDGVRRAWPAAARALPPAGATGCRRTSAHRADVGKEPSGGRAPSCAPDSCSPLERPACACACEALLSLNSPALRLPGFSQSQNSRGHHQDSFHFCLGRSRRPWAQAAPRCV